MKKLHTLLSLFAALLTVSSAAELSAQELGPRHELRLSAGVLPHWGGLVTYDYYRPSYAALRYQGPTYTSGVWTLSYGYRFKRWFDLSAALSYSGDFSAVYSNLDGSKLHPENRHSISVMPVARFTWLNRKWVRLYSSVGLGVMFDVVQGDSRFTELYFAGQLVPVGLAVGGAFFGFVELGVGTQGFALAGIGYRFNDKKGGK